MLLHLCLRLYFLHFVVEFVDVLLEMLAKAVDIRVPLFHCLVDGVPYGIYTRRQRGVHSDIFRRCGD